MSDADRPAATPRYRRVVDGSATVARGRGHLYVGVEHSFLAIIRDRAAVPTQALARLIDLDRVEAGLLEVMASPGYHGQPPTGAEHGEQNRLVTAAHRLGPGDCYPARG